MKKSMILLSLLLVTLTGFSQPRKYNKSMEKALASLNEASTPEALAASATSFEEIASLYPDMWMPPYYAAYCLISASFQTAEYSSKMEFLNQAKKDLESAKSLKPEESETEALDAYHALGMMAADPQSNGPIYLEDFNICIGKAKQLNPDNPRPYYMDGLLKANLPDYMGGGPVAARQEHQTAAKKYAEFRNDDPCWPRWGESQNQDALEGLQ